MFIFSETCSENGFSKTCSEKLGERILKEERGGVGAIDAVSEIRKQTDSPVLKR